MKIHKITDKIKIKIHDIEVHVSPLSLSQKTEIQSLMLKAGQDVAHAMKGTKLALQYAIKGIEGVEDGYELDIENNMLTDACVDELLNCSYSDEIAAVCIQLLKNIPNKFVDPSTGKELKGVEIVSQKKQKAKKN